MHGALNDVPRDHVPRDYHHSLWTRCETALAKGRQLVFGLFFALANHTEPPAPNSVKLGFFTTFIQLLSYSIHLRFSTGSVSAGLYYTASFTHAGFWLRDSAATTIQVCAPSPSPAWLDL